MVSNCPTDATAVNGIRMHVQQVEGKRTSPDVLGRN
jgi:hypothetical protein